MGRKALLWVLVLGGLSVVAVSVLADAVGLDRGNPVFGWEQKLGVVLGMSVAWFSALRLAGWVPARTRRAARSTKPSAPVTA
jgi:hypothetical protein